MTNKTRTNNKTPVLYKMISSSNPKAKNKTRMRTVMEIRAKMMTMTGKKKMTMDSSNKMGKMRTKEMRKRMTSNRMGASTQRISRRREVGRIR